MGRPGAFLEQPRVEHDVRDVASAVRDFDEIAVPLAPEDQSLQASRCMNCGVAFCQSGIAFVGSRSATGCPLHNLIPETNDLVYRRRWDDAADRLGLTNPFPEFTGRVCPSPCETACNLGLHDDPVTIHDNERAISDYSWARGIAPLPPASEDAPLVSVVGSGPAGLAAAWELARLGAHVRVYERDDRPGGLLMYGIPSMKLPKDVVERRVNLMKASGIDFACDVDAAQIAQDIRESSDAVVLAVGSRTARRVNVPGANLAGVLPAVSYLTAVTRALLDGVQCDYSAEGKDVIVVGGGDTGVDCVATALRQGARSVRQVIRAARAPEQVDVASVWPSPRDVFSFGYGQREACEVFGADVRLFSTDTVEFWEDPEAPGCVGGVRVKALDDTALEQVLPAQLVLIAKGFTGPEGDVLAAFGIDGWKRGMDGHVAQGLYLAGDARTGSSLVVHAIAEGLEVARCVAQDLGL